jgi:putative acetyltransferase
MTLVRQAVQEDSAAIGCVYVSAIRELAKTHYTAEQIDAWAGSRRPEYSQQTIEAGRIYVAEYEGQVAGYGIIELETKQVQAVYVSPHHARKGVGTAVLRALEQAAVEAGIDTLRLTASLNAVGFYQKAGYQELERTTHTLADGATRMTCVVMQKRLVP